MECDRLCINTHPKDDRDSLDPYLLVPTLLSKALECPVTSSYSLRYSASPQTVDVCSKHRIDIREHCARQMTTFDWTRFDVIAALDENVMNILSQQTKGSPHCISLVMLFLHS
jgi:protein-tyrosine-phosphatase